MRGDAEQALTLMWLLSWTSHSMCNSVPGRPRITRCRSPEKETFTCWWEPGSAGGLPTSYHLYYRKESSLEVFECPDYHKAGNNSCYFDKRHTSIWIIYNITVVASNALGKAYSESVEVDVMDIVQPHPPENVNVTFMQTTNSPYILVQWQPPHDADVHSGWVTIKYEVCLKISNRGDEEDSSWESYSAGKQSEFSMYSPQPGANYVVQVRCKLDHGLWSEWSPSAFLQIPDSVLTVKITPVKHFVLPPIPEPKISGLSTQLLQSGKSEEIFSALITPGYPQIAQSSDCQVECLVISDYDEEMDFDGIAHLDYRKGQNRPTDKAQKISQNCIRISLNSSQDLKTTLSENVHAGTISNQLSATSSVLGEPQQLLHLDCNVSPVKAQYQNTQMSSGQSCEHVSIDPAGLTEYVEVDKDQKAQVREDYSMVSDVISDNILVLQDNIPVQGHKEVKCDKKSKTEETGGIFEPLGYLETLTTFSSGS
ncbi:prolactin receptor b isoform X2 [Puntigrus tetrazona]|uniref:prolactin receptor b isoform X2 n=1 Tax=Puntigrus tetrazona TaxID=1606681 RepID=UPI001C890242|nr:prolactin receptor b isoform X2 [Puntigrus tetrazona]